MLKWSCMNLQKICLLKRFCLQSSLVNHVFLKIWAEPNFVDLKLRIPIVWATATMPGVKANDCSSWDTSILLLQTEKLNCFAEKEHHWGCKTWPISLWKHVATLCWCMQFFITLSLVINIFFKEIMCIVFQSNQMRTLSNVRHTFRPIPVKVGQQA